MSNTLTFLGTSTSVGIPVIGCDCPRCTSNDPKLHRMRSSVHIQTPDTSILVDAGPDLRQQALRHKLTKVDHVFYTHAHLDHIAGFDELRAFCWRRDDLLPLYGNSGCIEEIQRMFSWAFAKENTYKGYIRPIAKVIKEPVQLSNLVITAIPVIHGSVETSGYKFETNDSSVVYIPDVKVIPETSFELIGQPDYFIVDCLREEDHSSHMTYGEAIATIKKIAPKQAFLTHCAHEMDVEALSKQLPDNIAFAYDTLTIDF